ncbi:hypothetical protein BU14_0052s0067 [Porphyra umbilicalis]|uniref:Uncharacterized protein n=1 Tax=Porphyra umbilicalis TaxID=2786 RepID=A0A1X6PIF0_PORUM|nr:hypothetical protein BU14_0052s0067 [Porphyra umbilicalis]|eukprot:OSX80453.1 hypothetical protein BU14_0052s0067 [Porphyra umbilicalis]
MLHAGRSGFLHARATQAYLIAVMAATLVPTLLATRPGLLPRPPLAFPPPLSLLVLSVSHGLTVRSPASLIAGALFLYGTRHVERLSSTGVHGARLAAAAALYAAYTLVVGTAGVGVSPGPWGVIGVLVLDMAIEVPPLLGGPAPGLGVGDTGVMVGLALLALLLGGPGAAAAAAGGLLVGVVLRLGRGGAALRSPPRVPPLAPGGSPSAATIGDRREPAADGRGGADEAGGTGGRPTVRGGECRRWRARRAGRGARGGGGGGGRAGGRRRRRVGRDGLLRGAVTGSAGGGGWGCADGSRDAVSRGHIGRGCAAGSAAFFVCLFLSLPFLCSCLVPPPLRCSFVDCASMPNGMLGCVFVHVPLLQGVGRERVGDPAG